MDQQKRIIEAQRSHPGFAKPLGRNLSFWDYLLYSFLLLSLLSIILIFLQSNKELFPDCSFTDHTRTVFRFGLLNIRWLDYPTSMALFAGLYALLFARHQFALSQKPVLSYSPKKKTVSQTALKKARMFQTTTLENFGQGLAVVICSKYRLSHTADDLLKDYVTYSDVVDELELLGHIRNKSYALSYFSKGSTVAAGSETLIFEMPTHIAETFFALDIKIEYQGLLGDKYVKEIFCIARPFRRL